ncbi:DMT family transporter [Clostridium sp. NSJ-6]|uniref:DMT family transporter n=1 Tax=Clostridium hominis TaxID=2763036 RepID=A0ABR7D7L2_9CLOT|nr:DMT family transporter [Clostridium hominis]MBC5627366.1 DMT family transporter [Clostridium hominis]
MIILAMLGGILTTLSMIVNSSLGKKIGVLQSTCINYIVGLICSTLVLILLGSSVKVNAETFLKMPFYIFLGGAIGVSVVYFSNIIIPKIPVVYSTLLLFVGQVVTGIIIDFFVMSEISFSKLVGAIVIIIGILYNSKIDAKEVKE